jgi:hypothetical protein
VRRLLFGGNCVADFPPKLESWKRQGWEYFNEEQAAMRTAAFFRALSGAEVIFETPERRCFSKENFFAPVRRLNTATYVADERRGHSIYRPAAGFHIRERLIKIS